MFTPSLWPPWVANAAWTILILLGAYLAGYVIRAIVGPPLKILARRMALDGHGVLIREVKRRTPFWGLLIGVWLALARWPLGADAQLVAVRAIAVIGIASVTVAAANVAAQMVGKFGSRATPVSGLAQDIARIVVLVIGLGVVVRSLGYDLTPYLAALGVGGLAVALALQDPLSNLFAGVSITLSGQVRIGDYVKTDSGVEGYVTDFDWRATTVLMLTGSSVIIPNSKLAQAIVTNFHRPSRDLAVVVDLGVEHASDLEKVERVTLDVAREVMREVPGAMADFEPVVRFHTFAPASISFSVIMRGQQFADQFLVKHEFVKRVHARYRRDGIGVPSPKTILDVKGPISVALVSPADQSSS